MNANYSLSLCKKAIAWIASMSFESYRITCLSEKESTDLLSLMPPNTHNLDQSSYKTDNSSINSKGSKATLASLCKNTWEHQVGFSCYNFYLLNYSITNSVLISCCFALYPYEKEELIKPEYVITMLAQYQQQYMSSVRIWACPRAHLNQSRRINNTHRHN